MFLIYWYILLFLWFLFYFLSDNVRTCLYRIVRFSQIIFCHLCAMKCSSNLCITLRSKYLPHLTYQQHRWWIHICSGILRFYQRAPLLISCIRSVLLHSCSSSHLPQCTITQTVKLAVIFQFYHSRRFKSTKEKEEKHQTTVKVLFCMISLT